MINVLNMTKTGVVDDLFEFKFDFEFDNASTLPTKFVIIEQQKYLIANDSTAKNLSTNTYYKYNSADVCWVRSLAKTPTPTPKDNTQITENGNYNIVNNSFMGYNDISVNVEGSGSDVTLIEKSVIENGEYLASADNADGYSKVTVSVSSDNVFLVDPLNFSVETNLKKITIPNGVTQIADASFYGYKALTDVTIPSSVQVINEGAFSYCTALTNVTISDGVSSLQSGVFYGCKSLGNITIPASVTEIGGGTFIGCTSLETITINKPEGSISFAPWGAPSTTQIIWNG